MNSFKFNSNYNHLHVYMRQSLRMHAVAILIVCGLLDGGVVTHAYAHDGTRDLGDVAAGKVCYVGGFDYNSRPVKVCYVGGFGLN